jgi:hypothetical protein
MTNADKFRDLCRRAHITQSKAAQLIAEQTMRPCSVRAVRAWLANADVSSARPCPDWAVHTLETKLKQTGAL